MYTPPSKVAVRDMMPTLFDLLAEEENAAVRVVMGHFICVYIHSYFDGNGRKGRFVINLMMAFGGYPWAIVPVERRDEYMQALDAANIKEDIPSIVDLISRSMGDVYKQSFVLRYT